VTLQRPWWSLHSLSALVIIIIAVIINTVSHDASSALRCCQSGYPGLVQAEACVNGIQPNWLQKVTPYWQAYSRSSLNRGVHTINRHHVVITVINILINKLI